MLAPQVGLVRFNNFTLADNGAGPQQHIVNGKDNGGAFEMSWVVVSSQPYIMPFQLLSFKHCLQTSLFEWMSV